MFQFAVIVCILVAYKVFMAFGRYEGGGLFGNGLVSPVWYSL